MTGVIIGLRDLVYAKMESDTKEATTYGEVKPLANAINAGITPNITSESLYANDVAVATATSLGTVDVELEIDALDATVINDILGVEKDSNGVLTYNGDVNAPYVAIGFKSPLSNGNFRYVWLTKGMFSVPEDSYATKGENVEFQTKTISGTFVTRESDRAWKFEVDSGGTTEPSIIDNWLTAVYDPTATV